jgi:hypothetical protein
MTETKTPIPDKDVQDIQSALNRAAKRALELGLKTNTPVYVLKDGKIVDIAKEQKS